jgi:hypothetical protein
MLSVDNKIVPSIHYRVMTGEISTSESQAVLLSDASLTAGSYFVYELTLFDDYKNYVSYLDDRYKSNVILMTMTNTKNSSDPVRTITPTF